MTIEPANPDHISAITTIYARSVREETASFELVPPTEAEMAGRMQALLDAGYPWFVALNQGRVTGYAYGSAWRPRAAYGRTMETTVYVDPSDWGNGTGTALLSALVDAAQQRAMRQMIAVISCEADAVPETIVSVRLHKRHGFDVVGRLTGVGHKHGKWLDTVLMQKSLIG